MNISNGPDNDHIEASNERFDDDLGVPYYSSQWPELRKTYVGFVEGHIDLKGRNGKFEWVLVQLQGKLVLKPNPLPLEIVGSIVKGYRSVEGWKALPKPVAIVLSHTKGYPDELKSKKRTRKSHH